MEIFDTTLRDGTQSSEVNLSVRDKIELVRALDDFGVDYIELGWPGSNPKDIECFKEVLKLKLKNSKIVAFGSTRRKNMTAHDDPLLKALLESKAKVACIFGKTWLGHVEKQLNIKPEENLEAIADTVSFLKEKGLAVIYDLEHFFDGYKDNDEYALSCLRAAVKAGAQTVVLCDTNGGSIPSEVSEIVDLVKTFIDKNKYSVKLGVHMHNDSGFANANTLAAVELGCDHVHGTINGLGERVGNANLCTLIPALMLKKGYDLPNIKLQNLTKLSKMIYTLANLKPDVHQPYVGKNAFSHKGGVHVDAVMKGASYEHIDPNLVGNKREIVLSDLSGKANIVEVVKKFGFKVEKNNPKVDDMLKKVELMEKKGYDIGTLPAEQFLLTQEFFGSIGKIFSVTSWKIMSEVRNGEFSECVIIGKVDGKDREVVAPVQGGPVDAAFKSLKKMIATNYKFIEEVKLINYKVMIAEDVGAESSVRVYIEFRNGKDEWGTAGVSPNILEASMEAIEKGFRYYLLRHF
ncbi:MAG: citramalate synthase [Nanoarchaeota archaeon]|nr:citramalate synthase [Nanoarchaeota archaeon]MBU1704810.1 citramalate synthase [Nanoarchaeota archaeon]